MRDPDLHDSEGTELNCYGWQNCRATHGFFVCLDKHPFVGRRIHIFWAQRARKLVISDLENGRVPIYGSLDSGVQRTGAGFLYTLDELGAVSFPFRERRTDGTTSQRSKRIVKDFLHAQGYDFEVVVKKRNQLNQIDLIAQRGRDKPKFIEIKSRSPSKVFDKLFIQTHETNPGHRHD